MKKYLLPTLLFLFFLFGCQKNKKTDIQGPRPGVFTLGNVVLFVYKAPSTNITNVALTGDFFGWKKEGFSLVYDREVDLWRISLMLEPGIYQYKYILNGSILTNDSFNPLVAPDGKGSLNSIVEVKP